MPAFRLHALLDGRDTPPRSALEFVAALEAALADAHPDARIATVGGRYFAMDRDQRWERTERGYDAIVHGVGEHAPSATAAIEAAYARGENDEFVPPTVIDATPTARPAGPITDGEPVVHANFRADRARQLVHALADRAFDAFDRAAPDGRPAPADLLVVTMTEYEADLPGRGRVPAGGRAAASPERSPTPAGASSTSRRPRSTPTSRTSSTAAARRRSTGEERILVPSPKVATYDLQPEMSAAGVTDALVDGIGSGDYDFLVANFANPDMVGHTGDWDATVRRSRRSTRASGGSSRRSRRCEHVGRAPRHHRRPRQRRRDARRRTASPITAHSLNPVPILLAGRGGRGPPARRRRPRRRRARRSSSWPGLPAWPGMTGRSLLRG